MENLSRGVENVAARVENQAQGVDNDIFSTKKALPVAEYFFDFPGVENEAARVENPMRGVENVASRVENQAQGVENANFPTKKALPVVKYFFDFPGLPHYTSK